MEIKDRIKHLRKKLNLNQEDFGKRLGVARNTIACYETGVRTPMESTIKSICREFNADYRWLTTGDGDPFIKCDNEIAQVIDRIMFGESELAKSIFKGFAQFDVEDWRKLEEIIKKFLSGFSKEEVEAFLTGAASEKETQKKEADHDDQPPEV